MLDSKLWRAVFPQEIELAARGKQQLSVRLAFEYQDQEAELLLPLVVVHRGHGPAVLVAGGTHGDEFEGQMIVSKLCRETDPESVQGTLIRSASSGCACVGRGGVIRRLNPSQPEA